MKLNNNDDSHNSGLNLLIYNMLLDIESHPTWVCGLKQNYIKRLRKHLKVTPYVGVWIETDKPTTEEDLQSSHPTWVCGLKLNPLVYSVSQTVSHPTWVCGLKLPLSGNTHPACGVTPYVGVWIETIRMNT